MLFQGDGFQGDGFQGASAPAGGGGFDPTTVVPVNYDGLTTPKAKAAGRWPGLLLFGFALVTTAFDAALAVPPTTQAVVQGYKAPVKQAIQTQPQDGWTYAATLDPWTVAKFQTNTGERTPTRAALRFRYPLASAGFSTDGSTPPAGDTWDASKFQQIQSDRPDKRRGYDPRREYQKTSFALLDTRVVQPAMDQLASSDRMGARDRAIPETNFTVPFYPVLPVTDVWSVAKTPYVSFDRMADRRGGRIDVDVDALGWLYPTLPTPDVWSEAKFQNIQGERTPRRAALAFRYPLLTTGFSTDGSSPATGDVWDASKFQTNLSERMGERVGYDPRLEHHKFSFGLLDARAVMPAITQETDSYRSNPRPDWPPLDQFSQAWITAAVPPFDPRFFIFINAPDRMDDRHCLDLWASEYVYHLAWLHDVIPLTDTELRLYHKRPIAPIVNRKRRRRC